METDSFYIKNKGVIMVESDSFIGRSLKINVFLYGVSKLPQTGAISSEQDGQGAKSFEYRA